MQKHRFFVTSIICFLIALWCLYVLTGCASKQFYPGVCRHECIHAGTILVEKFGTRAVVAIGKSTTPGQYHCQAALLSEDGFSYTYFSTWKNSAMETYKHNWYTPEAYYPVRQFFLDEWGGRND